MTVNALNEMSDRLSRSLWQREEEKARRLLSAWVSEVEPAFFAKGPLREIFGIGIEGGNAPIIKLEDL